MKLVRLLGFATACVAVWTHGVATGVKVTPVLLRQRAAKAAAERQPVGDIGF